MADLLLVTVVCRHDISLAFKRLEYLNRLGIPVKKHPVLLINDGSVADDEFARLGNACVESGLYGAVSSRRILSQPSQAEWPYNVNHAWRTTAAIVAGIYGEKFDGNPYLGWFYFEPDVTPIHKDFATMLETQYVAPPVHQFMGVMSLTTASNGAVIRHLNGAAVYPISAQYYNQKMMLMDGIPWDVAGMDEGIAPQRKEIPSDVYTVAFGTRDYKRDGTRFTATQKLANGETKPFSFELNRQILHHGCKDGSLMDLLVPCAGSKPAMETSNPIKADRDAGMKWKDLMSKYRISPAKLKQALAA